MQNAYAQVDFPTLCGSVSDSTNGIKLIQGVWDWCSLTCSLVMFTLSQSSSLWTGALLSSASSVVRRQSSMASLKAVIARITIKGTALSAGLATPNMLKI